MDYTANSITLCGTLHALPEYSHSNHYRRFFRFALEVPRLSGTADVLPVVAAEDVLLNAELFAGGRFLVTGQLRSFNSRAQTGRKLILSVFAETLTTTEQPPENDVTLTGAVCKPPIFRRTPLGREICDVMLAVPRLYQRTDYIPCILWGRTAQAAAELPTGTRITVSGRMQSRAYIKVLPEGAEERTAYEVSAMRMELPEEIP